MSFHVPEQYRVTSGILATRPKSGNYGLFFIRHAGQATLRVIAGVGDGWEHVSVSLPNRCPTWAEMCKIKELFWDEDDCVMQLHPPKEDWVNNHEFCLHLWRPLDIDIPRPPAMMVGVKELGVLR